MAKVKKSKERGGNLRREAVGLIIIFVGLFIALALFEYHPFDPGFTTVSTTGEARNHAGIVGSYLADGLIFLVGLASFLFPLLLVYLGVLVMLGRDRGRSEWIIKSIGFAGFTVSVTGLLGIWPGVYKGYAEQVDAGGIIGKLISGLLLRLFNRPGALGILALAVIMTVMALTGFSPRAFARAVASLAKRGGKRFRTWRLIRQERRERIKEGKVIKARGKEQEKARLERKLAAASKDGPMIVEKKPVEPKEKPQKKKRVQESFGFTRVENYKVPSLKILSDPPRGDSEIDRESIMMNAKLLEKKLKDFSVEGEVVEIHPGPIITSYEFRPAAGVKVTKIVSLHDDLSMALSAVSVRIVAPIPGKDVVGIEIPNRRRDVVHLKEILKSDEYQNSNSPLTMALGKDIAGDPVSVDLRKMPHLLVAGATGAGKSVSLNSMLVSILMKATPDQVRFILIDPKRLELSAYEHIPHLLHPIITDPRDAGIALKRSVKEMEERYRTMAECGVRNIESFNKFVAKEHKAGRTTLKKKSKPQPFEDGEDSGDSITIDEKPLEKMPYILVVIDELSDLMMVAAREVEESITRLAQMARAAGIHLIIATQRPSVDVITGLIKANFPARISFQTTSKIDSRTILDTMGAERLLGMGDMLYLAPGTSNLVRIHGAYVSDTDIRNLTEFLRGTGEPVYDESFTTPIEETGPDAQEEEYDEKYDEAVEIVAQTKQASISMLQRKLRVGYNRSARMIERMENDGIVGPSDGVKLREVLIDPVGLEEYKNKRSAR